jgi:hypothetical protein
MSVADRSEFPEIRVQSTADLPQRSAPEELPTETNTERLARLWIKAWSVKKEAEARMNALRKEIEAILDEGEIVGNSTGYVVWETTKRLRADPAGLLAAVGPQTYLRVSEVSTTKVRELIQAGLVPMEADYLTTEVVRRLATRLR